MNKNQEEHMKQRVKKLSRENRDLQDGLDQMIGLVDAIMIRIGMTFGEEREGGWRLEVSAPDLKDLTSYEVKTQRNDKTNTYVIGVFKKTREGGKPPDSEAKPN